METALPKYSYHIQGPAEIPDDLVTQLWVEPLAWGICPWALFWRASGFCCADVFQKQRFCRDWGDISSALQYSSERVSLVAILLPLRISQEQGARKETKGNGGFETEHQGRSGSNFSQHATTCEGELLETLGGICWQGTPPHRHYSGSKCCN